MSKKPPNDIAASVKVIADAIKTTFGAAIVANTFAGIALVSLASGFSNLESNQRERLMYVLISFIFLTLIGLFCLRIFKPEGLSGPIPQATNNTITDSEN